MHARTHACMGTRTHSITHTHTKRNRVVVSWWSDGRQEETQDKTQTPQDMLPVRVFYLLTFPEFPNNTASWGPFSAIQLFWGALYIHTIVALLQFQLESFFSFDFWRFILQ